MLFKKNSFLILIYLTRCVLTGNICLNDDLGVKLSDRVGDNYLLVTTAISNNLADCVSSCVLKWKCVTFFYHLTTKECRHYSGKISALNLNTETNWVAHQIADRPVPEVLSMCSSSEGYVFDTGSNMCYKVHTDTRRWNDARDVCLQEGGDMVMLSTDAKKSLIEGIVTADGQNEYFLGATDRAKEGEWRWIADNSLIPWFTKKNLLPSDCFEVQSNLQYDDTGCNIESQKFVCEKR